jgi:hypothetical protein
VYFYLSDNIRGWNAAGALDREYEMVGLALQRDTVVPAFPTNALSTHGTVPRTSCFGCLILPHVLDIEHIHWTHFLRGIMRSFLRQSDEGDADEDDEAKSRGHIQAMIFKVRVTLRLYDCIQIVQATLTTSCSASSFTTDSLTVISMWTRRGHECTSTCQERVAVQMARLDVIDSYCNVLNCTVPTWQKSIRSGGHRAVLGMIFADALVTVSLQFNPLSRPQLSHHDVIMHRPNTLYNNMYVIFCD